MTILKNISDLVIGAAIFVLFIVFGEAQFKWYMTVSYFIIFLSYASLRFIIYEKEGTLLKVTFFSSVGVITFVRLMNVLFNTKDPTGPFRFLLDLNIASKFLYIVFALYMFYFLTWFFIFFIEENLRVS